MDAIVFKRLAAVRSVPRRVLAVTGLASAGGVLLGLLAGWPLWGVALGGLVPWLPVLSLEMAWFERHYGWLAFFYVLVISQGGHIIEHIAQVTQIHVLDKSGADARGIFGALDIEWVHFIWNGWILVAVAALLTRFRTNPWLWAMLAIALWHESEHAYIMTFYLRDGVAGTPGLLADGGALAGGLGIKRPDLHFFYNVVETVPLVAAFLWQVRRSHDEWLATAFPRLSAELLVETTGRLQTARFASGQAVLRQSDAPDLFYIVVRGEVEVIRDGCRLATLGPGQFFGEIGVLADDRRTASVVARTPVELLSLDGASLRRIVAASQPTSEDLSRVIRERLATA